MSITPMMDHYKKLKEQYKDCVLFYRLGDFYEMFYDDAKKVSSLLDLTLTGRDCGLEERAPMCGIPFHAADVYIAKLVALGEKVAICEQLSEPSGKTIVKRDVIKIVTAGTITNNELIDEKNNNFLCSVYWEDGKIFAAWADITTGEFYAQSFSAAESADEFGDFLVKIAPAEIISNEQARKIFNRSPLVTHSVIPKFSYFTESEYDFDIAQETLKEQLNLSSLSALNPEKGCVCAAGALISYLKETQKHALKNIDQLRCINGGDFMMLDSNAVRNLELVRTLRDSKRHGSLLWLLDRTKTSMGARKLQNWILSPLKNVYNINYRLEGVDGLYNNTLIRESLYNLLGAVKDVGRIAGKISNGNLMPKDCVALYKSLEIIPNIKFQLSGIQAKIINDLLDKLKDFSDTVKLLSSAIEDDPPANVKDGGYIKKGFNKELDELRGVNKNGKDLINDLEREERERTGIKTLKIKYNRVFGYFIEITNSFKHMAPYDYVRRQTLANAERFVTEKLKELEVKILYSDEKALTLESEIFKDIKNYLLDRIDLFKDAADAISDLDVLISLAIAARECGYVKPKIVEAGSPLVIKGGRHPVVESLITQKFIPNDCLLDNNENRTMIITGPNMAGKSTYMRQTALIVLMAHMGSFVPADSAEIPLTDKIFTRIGASDSLISDQSTFMVEMTETANILLNATKDSLLILDEIGRGTSTFDGLSIAWAVVEYVTERVKAKTMFATHYHELTELENFMQGVKNYKVTVKELQGAIVFLRKIMRGGANRSFGIEVAELAGVNKSVTNRAKEILKQLEKSDITKGYAAPEKRASEKEAPALSETEKILGDIDVNNLSPMQAFNILIDLHDKIKEKL